MQGFLHLFDALDKTRTPSEQVSALTRHFQEADPADAACALSLLLDGNPRKIISAQLLREWVANATGFPDWLMDASHAEVGDLPETLARLWPRNGPGIPLSLHDILTAQLLPLSHQDTETQRQSLSSLWDQATPDQRIFINKFITGTLRMAIPRGLVAQALAAIPGLPPSLIEQRLISAPPTSAIAFQALISPAENQAHALLPHPFHLALPLLSPPETLGSPAAWQAEWIWSGTRAQLIHRNGNTLLSSRGGEVITDSFPEIAAAASALPDGTVLDGALLAWRGEAPLPPGELQRRTRHRNPTPKLIRDLPVIFMVFDCLEVHHIDLRAMPLHVRHAHMLPMFGTEDTPLFRVSEPLLFRDWQELAALRNNAHTLGAGGIILKALTSPYQSGRERGLWWKWKSEPFRMTAVLLYAQAGRGNRAGARTDYTFGLRHEDQFIPFAKTSSGLTDAEIKRVDSFIRAHTLEKHGPVRVVEPKLVFEIAFEGLQPSNRHKCGIAVLLPRITRLLPDISPAETDSLTSLRHLLPGINPG